MNPSTCSAQKNQVDSKKENTDESNIVKENIIIIIAKAYRTMVESDPRLKEALKKLPMVAYRLPPSLREKVIRAKVPPSPNPNARPK